MSIEIFDLTILIFTVVLQVLGSVFVYKNNPKSATNILFAFLSLVTSIWLVLFFVSIHLAFFDWALLLTRLTVFFAVPQSFLFFLFAWVLPKNTLNIKKKNVIFLSISTILVMLFTLTRFVFEGVDLSEGSLVYITGHGMIVFSIYTASLSLAAVFVLLRKVVYATGLFRQQLLFILLGVLCMLSLIIGTIMVPIIFFKNSSFVSLVPLYVLIFFGMAAYTIIKHKFLDVRLVLVRTVSYTALVFFLAVVYVGIMLAVATQIFEFTIDRKFLVLVIVLTTFITLSFGPLSKYVKHLTDKVFFKGEYDSGKLLTQLTHVMAHTIDLDRMTSSILEVLVKNMRVSRAAFLILEDHKLIDTKEVCVEGDSYSIKEEEFEKLREYFHKDIKKNAEASVFREMGEDIYKKVFRNVGISIAIPIRTENDDVAILLLDKKMSGEIYTLQDINFLEIFAVEAGISIQNAKSYEKVKRFSEELEDRVQQRTKELKEAQTRELKKAQDVVRLKDEFVFVATHELRAPITAIRLFLEMMPKKTNFFPKDIQEKLDSMAQASDHLNQLINDLLEIAQSETRSMKIVVEPIDVVEIMQNQIQELAATAEKKKVKVSFIQGEKVSNVMADTKKITEVITNLLSNAIKYNREGGSVEVCVLEREKDVVLEVKDTGFGIPKEQQKKIFQKFFRASSRDTSNVLGTGLGLFIARMLVEKMGGEIKFTSVQGEGTTFAFSLPKESL